MSPVRVRRGRAAAYRSLWQWPLRTPARAAGSAIAALALAAGLAALTAVGAPPTPTGITTPETTDTGRRAVLDNAPTRRPESPAPSTADTTATAAAPTPETSDPTPSTDATAAPSEPATDPAAVARTWATRWLNTRQPAAAWLDGLAPYTTEEYLGLLSSVDTTALPAGTVTGDPITVSTSPSSATIDVPTTTLQLRLTLIETPNGWRVANSDRSS